jgi:hypothetical protein
MAESRACWPEHTDCAHREHIGAACYLWSEPAILVKDAEGYAHIRPLDNRFGSVSYSWAAVFNTMANRSCRFTD